MQCIEKYQFDAEFPLFKKHYNKKTSWSYHKSYLLKLDLFIFSHSGSAENTRMKI